MSYNKITAGFALGAASPVTSGIEDVIYVFNEDDFTVTYDTTNPLIVTGIAAVSAAKMYKFTGTNNSFNSTSKMARTQVGPRYTEEIDFNIAGHSTAIKAAIQSMGYGKVKAICINNYKDEDAYAELFGAINGLTISEAERNAGDEAIEGGYKLKLAQPEKLREPYPPRAINITSGGTGTATYETTITALDALCA